MGDHIRERDNRSIFGGREVFVNFACQSTQFDEIRRDDTIIAKKLPAIILDSFPSATKRGQIMYSFTADVCTHFRYF